MTVKLRDYRPSGSVDVLMRLAVSTMGDSDDVGIGITMSIIALIDAETDGLYSDEEIGRHAGRLIQGYVTRFMQDPW